MILKLLTRRSFLLSLCLSKSSLGDREGGSRGFWTGFRNGREWDIVGAGHCGGHFLVNQSFPVVGDHPRCSGLVLRDLLRVGLRQIGLTQ